MQSNVKDTAPASTDEVVIRWYARVDRTVTFEYEYQLPDGKEVSGSFFNSKSLGSLRDNLNAMGHNARLERGHYKQEWVPDGQ